MQEAPPKFPRIILYLAVSKASRDRLVLQNGISEDRVRLVLNFVDLNRFLPRDPLPEVPRRALVFGNHFNEKFGLATIREVCAKSGLQLNALGGGGGRLVRHPEKLLHDYDIVFAKGRCALEALTVGCAVVLCSVEGIGPTIRPANVDGLRLHNFGAGTLTTPLSTELLVERIKEYNSVEAAEVSKRVREIAGTDTAVDEMQRIYREVVATHEQAGPADPNQEMKLVSDYLREWGSTFYGWQPEAHYRKVSAKLDAVYASATWRWTQGFLRLPGLRFLLAPIVRRVARTPREPK